MFNLSRQTRSTLLLIFALAIVPVTIDTCAGGGSGKVKDKFEIVTLLGIGTALVALGAGSKRRERTPQAA